MATRRWTGNAVAIKQVTTLTIGGTWLDTETLTLTINDKELVVTLGDDATTGEVATLLAAAFNASTAPTLVPTGSAVSPADGGQTIPELSEIIATASGSVVTLTSRTAGKGFSVTAGETSTSGTITPATPIAATGPNWFTDPDNWTGNAVPVDGDDIVFDSGSIDCTDGLEQSAVTPTSFTATAGYTGRIGRPETNVDNPSKPYREYRGIYLQLGNDGSSEDLNLAAVIGGGEGQGSSRIRLDFGAGQVTLKVLGTGQPAEQGVPALLVKGTHIDNDVTIQRGSVGFAFFAGETTTISTLRVGYTQNVEGDSNVICGAGCTVTNLDVSGGIVQTNSGATTLDQTDGDVTLFAGNFTTLNVDGGATRYRGTGTITNLNVGDGGEADFGRDMKSRTVTNCQINAGGTIRDPNKTVTFTNGIDLNRCAIEECTLDIGTHLTMSLSAI